VIISSFVPIYLLLSLHFAK